MAHFSAQRVRGANHRSLRKAGVRHWERWFSETGCSVCLIKSNNLKSSNSIFLFKLISLYGSFPCSLFALHYWAFPGADVCGQALPVRGPSAPHAGAALPCRVLSAALQLLPHQFTYYFSPCTWGKLRQSICTPQKTLGIPCGDSLLSYLPTEKIIANLACVTHEQLMEMTAFSSIPLSLFFMPRGMPAAVLYCGFWSLMKKKGKQ